MKKKKKNKMDDTSYDIEIKYSDDFLDEDEEGVKNLYIIIDKKPYVDIDTCVLATNIVNPILDEADLIEESYVLNVCSKGGE